MRPRGQSSIRCSSGKSNGTTNNGGCCYRSGNSSVVGCHRHLPYRKQCCPSIIKRATIRWIPSWWGRLILIHHKLIIHRLRLANHQLHNGVQLHVPRMVWAAHPQRVSTDPNSLPPVRTSCRHEISPDSEPRTGFSVQLSIILHQTVWSCVETTSSGDFELRDRKQRSFVVPTWDFFGSFNVIWHNLHRRQYQE